MQSFYLLGRFGEETCSIPLHPGRFRCSASAKGKLLSAVKRSISRERSESNKSQELFLLRCKEAALGERGRAAEHSWVERVEQ